MGLDGYEWGFWDKTFIVVFGKVNKILENSLYI